MLERGGERSEERAERRPRRQAARDAHDVSPARARDLAERVIRRSPESVRVVAWLHYVDGIDQGEVARVLGLSRRTVASRVAEFRRLAFETAGRAA